MEIETIQQKISLFRNLMILTLIAPWVVFFIFIFSPVRLPRIFIPLWAGVHTALFAVSLFMATIWFDQIRQFSKNIDFFITFQSEGVSAVRFEHYSPFCFPFSKEERTVTFAGEEPRLPSHFEIEIFRDVHPRSRQKKMKKGKWYDIRYLRLAVPFEAEQKLAIVSGGVFSYDGTSGDDLRNVDVSAFPFPYILSVQKISGMRTRNQLVCDVFDIHPRTEDILEALIVMENIRRELYPSGTIDSKPVHSSFSIQRVAATTICEKCELFIGVRELRKNWIESCPFCEEKVTGHTIFRLNQ